MNHAVYIFMKLNKKQTLNKKQKQGPSEVEHEGKADVSVSSIHHFMSFF